MDTQQVELLGRNQLISELLRADLEVAIPERDKGIDLIAYVDKDKFLARPIQLKASIGKSFSIDKKYSKFPDMIIAYVWYANEPAKTVTYALTYSEAIKVADQMGWTKTTSWKSGKYVTTKPGAKLLEMLKPFKMTMDKWKAHYK